MSNKTIDSFLYIDEGRIRMILDQFPETKIKRARKRHTIGGSFFNWFKYDQSIEPENINTYEQINLLNDLLVKNHLLACERPKTINTELGIKQKFVHEIIPATKLVFLKEKTDLIPGVEKLIVWISDPAPNDLSDNWKITGTFLYLIEATVKDDGHYLFGYSGKSALLTLYNLVVGNEFFDTSINVNGEPLGESSYKHPVRKLKEMGAREVGTENIDVLYQCRFMSNEQAYVYNRKKRRVCDLLGYPIYIKQP